MLCSGCPNEADLLDEKLQPFCRACFIVRRKEMKPVPDHDEGAALRFRVIRELIQAVELLLNIEMEDPHHTLAVYNAYHEWLHSLEGSRLKAEMLLSVTYISKPT